MPGTTTPIRAGWDDEGEWAAGQRRLGPAAVTANHFPGSTPLMAIGNGAHDDHHDESSGPEAPCPAARSSRGGRPWPACPRHLRGSGAACPGRRRARHGHARRLRGLRPGGGWPGGTREAPVMARHRSITLHLAKGCVGLGSLAVIAVAPISPWWPVGLVPLTLVSLGGCPACWTMGLVERVLRRPGRPERTGARDHVHRRAGGTPARRWRAGCGRVSRPPARHRRSSGPAGRGRAPRPPAAPPR